MGLFQVEIKMTRHCTKEVLAAQVGNERMKQYTEKICKKNESLQEER
jgi:hypothetical protein